MYHAIIIAIIISDQIIKHLIRSGLNIHESIPVIDGVLHITHVNNTGGAFGLFAGQTLVLSAVTAVILAAILVYIQKNRKGSPRVFILSLSLICAGGLGNLTDRLIFKAVTDFIDFRVFPVFNLADISVTCGCGLLLLYFIFFDKKESVKKEAAEDAC